MIEAKQLEISNAKQEAGRSRSSVESRVIQTLSEFGNLAIWSEQYVKSNCRDVFGSGILIGLIGTYE